MKSGRWFPNIGEQLPVLIRETSSMRRSERDRSMARGGRILHNLDRDAGLPTMAALRHEAGTTTCASGARTWAGYGPMAAAATVARGALGVMLSRKPGLDGADCYEVSIVFAEGRASTPILFAVDDSDVVARWRRYAADLGLPMMIEDSAGTRIAPWGQIGRVSLGEIRLRRRSAAIARRRPLFLTRRRMGLPVATGG